MPKVLDARERFGTGRQTCRCGRWPQPCAAPADAEDLLCRWCRDGRCQQLQVATSAGVTFQASHVHVTFNTQGVG